MKTREDHFSLIYRAGNSAFRSLGRSKGVGFWIAISVVLFLPICPAVAQSPRDPATIEVSSVGIRGSFVIAAICKDGIVVASESRGNIFDRTDPQQKPIAYFDTIQKTFPIGSNAIAETGQGIILEEFFSSIVEKFVQGNPSGQVNRLLPAFIAYCERALPLQKLQEIKKQRLFAAGYLQGRPTICYSKEEQPGDPFGCIQDQGYVQSDATLLSNYGTNLSSLPVRQVAELAKKAIQAYAKEGDRWKTIGGPIRILIITEKGTYWLEGEPPKQRWVNVQEFVQEYRQGKITIQTIPPAGKEQLDQLFGTVLNVK